MEVFIILGAIGKSESFAAKSLVDMLPTVRSVRSALRFRTSPFAHYSNQLL